MLRCFCRLAVLAGAALLLAQLPARSALGAAPRVRAQFATGVGTGPSLQLEVADTVASRATGLMYRRRLPPKAGMLFVFDDAAPRSFWMKDTYLPLDMIFVDDACQVVHIIAGAEPHSTASQSCPRPVRLVVELLAGSVAKLGIGVGQQLQLVGKLPGRPAICPRGP